MRKLRRRACYGPRLHPRAFFRRGHFVCHPSSTGPLRTHLDFREPLPEQLKPLALLLGEPREPNCHHRDTDGCEAARPVSVAGSSGVRGSLGYFVKPSRASSSLSKKLSMQEGKEGEGGHRGTQLQGSAWRNELVPQDRFPARADRHALTVT